MSTSVAVVLWVLRNLLALLQVKLVESFTYTVAVTISISVLTEVIDCVKVTESTSVDVCVCTETTVTDCVLVIESISISVAVVVAVVDTVIVACQILVAAQ